MVGTNKGLLLLFVVVAGLLAFGGWRFPAISDALNLARGPEISRAAQAHILSGDESGGGHKYGVNKPCKSEFPKEWDAAEILGHVRAIAANDNLEWKRQRNGYYVAADTIDDVKVRVVLDRERDDVVTAYPIDGTINACPSAPQKNAGHRAEKKRPVKIASHAPARHSKKRHTSPRPASPPPVKSMPNASNRAPTTQNFNR